MGYYCTVPQCTSLAGKTKNVKFHRFPRDETMADKWNLILKRGKPYTKYSKVCSLHFTQGDYNVTTMGQWKTLSKDAVPSQNLPKLNPDGTVMVIRKSRTVKYREGKKDDISSDKQDKWPIAVGGHNHSIVPSNQDSHMMDAQDALAYRYPLTNMTLATQQIHNSIIQKPKKQDAIMQTDPVQSEEDDSQPNNSYSEVAEKYAVDIEYGVQNYTKEPDFEQKYEAKDYTNKNEDYIPQTNEEYNKEAEKYALERKSLNGYEKSLIDFQKPLDSYQKLPDVYPFNDKAYQRSEYMGYSYHDSVEHLRNQQQNLQILQEQHRITENQNFFNENHIKQEIDINGDDDKFIYERSKVQIDVEMYNSRRLADQQRLLETLQHPVKQEPDISNGCDNVMQPQGSPYYQSNSHNNAGAYYSAGPRPGAELLIAKQNALAAHTQLWQNTMKRPFFYSESPHYNGAPLLHRYEDITRILQ